MRLIINITWVTGLILPAIILNGCAPISIASMAMNTVNTTVKTAESMRVEREAEKEINAKISEANLNLGIELMRQGNYERSLERLLIALEASPEQIEIHNVLGLVKQSMGLYGQSEDHFFDALKIEPDNSDTLNNYGQLLCQQGNINQAVKYFERSASNPFYEKPELPYTNAGLCVLKNNLTTEAETYFSAALEKNSDVAPALLKMAQINFDKSNYEEAKEYFDRYDMLATHNPESLWLGINIENILGNKDAVSSYALLLRIEYPEAKETTMLESSGIK